MNCELYRNELDDYLEGGLTRKMNDQLKSHLESCNDCSEYFKLELFTKRIISDEKKIQSNPFLATRIIYEIEELDKLQSELRRQIVPSYIKVLRPVLVSITLAAAIMAGVMIGNIYSPVTHHVKIPVEMVYINDAALESVNLLSNN